MYTALNKLGYKCYHMIEVPKNRKTKHLECWHEGLSIKLNGKGKKYGAVELDKILRDYSVSISSNFLLYQLYLHLFNFPD